MALKKNDDRPLTIAETRKFIKDLRELDYKELQEWKTIVTPLLLQLQEENQNLKAQVADQNELIAVLLTRI